MDIQYSINTYFSSDRCKEIYEFCKSNGEGFLYKPTDIWDCKRIYDENFNKEIVDHIHSLHQSDKLDYYFDFDNFDLKNTNISLTQYYDGRYLNLHTDSTSNYTTVIVLTEDFTDGRFCLSKTYRSLKESDLIIDLKIGQGITFNGSIWHGVLPVTSGTRAALNLWMNNTDFKFTKTKINNKLF
jgi:predicted 2-oxoglutarate/Fe(II)-dependent dioxygenase YbiX